MIMNKNMLILLGLIITWLFAVISKENKTETNKQDTTKDTTVDTDENEEIIPTKYENSGYVKVSVQNATNTSSPYENKELSPYGRSYTA